MAYDAGEAFLSIVPSFRGVVESIDREAAKWGLSAGRQFARTFNEQVRSNTNNAPLGPSTSSTTRQGQQAGRTFADSFRARVEAALRSLPDVQINADSTAAEVRIARLRTNLEQLRDQRVGIDITSEMALASIGEIKRQLDELRASSPDVAVQVDTLHASEELARIQAEISALRTESPDVAVNVSDRGTAAAVARDVNGLQLAMVGLVPLAAPVGAALIGAFAGALSIVGVLGAAIGTIGLGMADVPKAVQLLGQRQTATGPAAAKDTSNQQAVLGAQQSLGDTQRQVARQRVSDAQAVAAAERSLGQADQAVTVAQQGLNAAREQAVRDLQDLKNKATDAQLSQKQAAIDLANAQANLAATNANWTSTAEQRKQAQLDVAKAEQGVREANLNSKRATEDNNKAQKAGVSGQPGVISAQRQLTSAIQQQHDAVRSLQQAQVQQQQDAADGARSIARAQQAVAQAMQRTGAVGVDSLAGIDSQLANLPPAVVQFAKFWRSYMSPILNQLENKAASGLFPGVERGLKILRPLFGPLGDFLHTMGKTLGTLFVQAARALTGPAWTRLFKLFSAEAPRWLMEFGHIVGNSILGIVQLLQAFAPVTDLIGAGLVKITSGFAKWAGTLDKNKGFQTFIEYIKQNGPILLDALGKIFVIVGKLLVGLAPLGHVLLIVTDAVAGFLSKLSPNELLGIALAVGVLWAAIGGPVTGIVIAITAAAALIVKNWSGIVAFFKTVWEKVLGFFKQAWHDIKSWFLDGWHWVKNVFGSLWHGLYDLYVRPYVIALAWINQHFWTPVKNAFMDAWHWVKNTFSSIWHGLTGVLRAPIDAFTNVIGTLWGAIKRGFTAGIHGVKTAAAAAWGAIEKIFESPIYYVVKYAYQDGIRALWDATAGKIGLPDMPDLSGFLDHLQHFAEGGVRGDADVFPGYAPGHDSMLAWVSPGEGVLRPEVVRDLSPETIYRWNRNRAADHFSGGGISGGPGPGNSFQPGIEKSGGGSWIGDLNPLRLIEWVRSHWSKLTGTIGNLVHKIGHSAFGKMMIELPSKLAKKIPGYIIGQLKSLAGAVGGALGSTAGLLTGGDSITQGHGGGGLGASGPRAVWKALLAGGLPPIQAAGVMGNVQSESGFDPWVIQGGGISANPADAGGAGYGLVQWTPGAKLIPYLHGAIPSVVSEVSALLQQLMGRGPSPESAAGRALMGATNPAAAATIFGTMYERYAGGVQMTRANQAQYWYNQFAGGPKAYAAGGVVPSKAAATWFDQGGPLQPGLSMVYNGTGQAELVAPAKTFEQIMRTPGGGGRIVGKLAITPDSQGQLEGFIDARIDDRAGFADAIGRTG